MNNLKKRAKIVSQIRSYFDNLGFLEVETPLLVKNPIPESTINLFSTELDDGYGNSEKLFLTPSPEVGMKKLISDGSGSIYQICKSFRNCEIESKIHNHEFTMLEYYSVGSTYEDSIKITEGLFDALGCLCKPPFLVVTVNELFKEHLNIDLEYILSEKGGNGLLSKIEAMKDGLQNMSQLRDEFSMPESFSDNDVFNALFVGHIEPKLPGDKIVIVKDYPALVRTTAAGLAGSPWAQRWELYFNGVEVANCYTEAETLTDYVLNESGNIDNFKDIKLPLCSGVALGVDRLCACLLELDNISKVMG